MKYRLPFPETVETRISKPKGEYAHENFPESRHAVDFLLDVGTPILAVKGGTVVKTKSDSNEWGVDKKFAEKANYVAVKHGDGTYAEYLHLGKDKVVVRKGQKIKAGDLLGHSGLTGYMDKPHLHLNLFRIEGDKAISIPYEVQESEKDRERKPPKGRLEKILGIMFIVGIGIYLLSLSKITGNVVSIDKTNLYSSIIILIVLIFGGIWIFLRNR